jgi:hypothetical protein
MWIEKEISIAEIDTLLNNGYEVEVDSPDGMFRLIFLLTRECMKNLY